MVFDRFAPQAESEQTSDPIASQSDTTNLPPSENKFPSPLVSISSPDSGVLPSSLERGGPGRELLLQAKQNLQQIKPFRAHLTQTIRIGKQPILAKGDYIEGLAHQLRMELDVTTPNTQGRLLNVCDGSILWTELVQHTPELAPEGKTKITRRDLGSILQMAQTSNQVENARYISDLAVGGLTALFASLDKQMVFSDPVEFMQQNVRLWKLEGTWSQEFLDQHHVASLKKLPRHVPAYVEVYLDFRTLFPHRILFTREQENGEQLKLITFDFADVQFQAELSEALFEYGKTDESYDDVTNQYERKLHERN
ncbi:MAG: hypothetical protein KDA65_09395 [Planctomycetaceae bacterium]|nr:hypothetical protein [Planctomycetaceae bacterium]